ncbi:MAG: TlyA family RNA methyltransferase [Candidatus Taylorbacteria bacterium]|nr:TlyA family RNA methyltransferase [Candidatus Taylorbacteria bacterium]
MENPSSLEHGNRLDVEAYRRGLTRSRSLSADLIKRGKMRVNGKVALKASLEVRLEDDISIEGGDTFVSRAGEKLSFAIEAFKLDFAGATVIDIGSSTGGFVDCLLKKGAAKVIAVDVGTDQLDSSLRDDPRIELHESTDIRKFCLPSPVDAAVIDVSFISLSHILPKAYELVKNGGRVVALVKPQFEVGKEIADRFKGIISDEKVRHDALQRVRDVAKSSGFSIEAEAVSPIEGEKGNKEFLLLLSKHG